MTRVLDLPYGTPATWADPDDGCSDHVWLAVRDRNGEVVAGVCRDCDSTYWLERKGRMVYPEPEYISTSPMGVDSHIYRAPYWDDAA